MAKKKTTATEGGPTKADFIKACIDDGVSSPKDILAKMKATDEWKELDDKQTLNLIGNYKSKLKKAAGGTFPASKPGRKPAAPAATEARNGLVTGHGIGDLILATREIARQLGGMAQLKTLVENLKD